MNESQDTDFIEFAQQGLMERGTCECPLCGRLHHKLANDPPRAITEVQRLREKMGTLARVLAPGNRTLDDMIRDIRIACDIAREASR